MRKMFGILILAGLFPGVIAGGGHGGSVCDGFDTGSTVRMLDSCFAGTAHFTQTGSSVVIENEGRLPHTFTAADGSFDSGQISPGSSFELNLDTPGIYKVYCTLHGTAKGQGMAGVLVVGEVGDAEFASVNPEGTKSPVDSTANNWPMALGVVVAAASATALALRASRRLARPIAGADHETATTHS